METNDKHNVSVKNKNVDFLRDKPFSTESFKDVTKTTVFNFRKAKVLIIN